LDLTAVRPGAVKVESSAQSLTIVWEDAASRTWRAEFSLDPAKPLITSIGINGKHVIERARPLYDCGTGTRRGGWDEFFDFPPGHPGGTRNFLGEFKPVAARARTVGERVELSFDGLHMGIFSGGITYVFYPGSRLVQQKAVVTTNEPDVAYYYNAGLRFTADSDVRPGENMETEVAYFDTEGRLRNELSDGPERRPLAFRYRTLAVRTAGGSIAVFPAPHQYFMPRDFTSNMGYLWHNAWRGSVSIGIRQLPDDNSSFYPWVNAPPGTEQQLSVFFLLTDRDSRSALADVLRYTHEDRFPALEGFQTLAAHWHFDFTVQVMAKGSKWVPPFKPVLKAMGVDAALLMDFHSEGHPDAVTEIRLEELDAYFHACRAQSDPDFLLIPAEEANVYLGGHYGLIFPKPVYWFKKHPGSEPFVTQHPKYGTVYFIGSAKEMYDLIRRESGYVYQTHPRTKSSVGFPDRIRDTDYFRDARYFGAGWKAIPADLSSPRLGERAFKLLDDMSDWGLRKFLLGEVDVFQIDHTHELYGHMNVNYVRLPKLPDYDHYGTLLEAVARGDFFVTTGEVLLPAAAISGLSPDEIAVKATVDYTFPLRLAEIVWGDGTQVSRAVFPLDWTREFSRSSFEWKAEAKGWKWARVAVWDVAGNGAFTQPVWK
jgi:hypothetical protein